MGKDRAGKGIGRWMLPAHKPLYASPVHRSGERLIKNPPLPPAKRVCVWELWGETLSSALNLVCVMMGTVVITTDPGQVTTRGELGLELHMAFVCQNDWTCIAETHACRFRDSTCLFRALGLNTEVGWYVELLETLGNAPAFCTGTSCYNRRIHVSLHKTWRVVRQVLRSFSTNGAEFALCLRTDKTRCRV